jgi:hypothetical protein
MKTRVGLVVLVLLLMSVFSFALIAAPDEPLCGLKDITYSMDCNADNNTLGASKAYWDCYDGTSGVAGGIESCKTQETWKNNAIEACAGKCQPKPCFGEGQSMAIYPGNACCSGLSAINPVRPQTDGTCQLLVGASICSNCGNGTCEAWENTCNCSTDCKQTNPVCPSVYAPVCAEKTICSEESCVSNSTTTACQSGVCTTGKKTYSNKCAAEVDGAKVLYAGECVAGCTSDSECKETSCPDGSIIHDVCQNGQCVQNQKCLITEPVIVNEQVKCLFNSSNEKQKCYSFFKDRTFSCATGDNGNFESCVANISAPKGTKLIWKSSCGGYAYTVNDGDSEYAKFDCQTDDNGSVPVPACACTKEYMPVCGSIKICATACESKNINSNETSSCQEKCYEQRKTFGNSCEAKCAGVESIVAGECAQTCPVYAQPNCPNGKIEVTYDERGCKKPRCVEEKTEHFTGAYWQCSNGKEFKEANNCMPYAFWKEKARNTCAQYSSKCGSVGESTTTSTTPATGNFILDAVTAATNVVTGTATSVQAPPQEMPQKCIGGEVVVSVFEPFGNCSPAEKCKFYVNEEGCKVKECVNGEKEVVCPNDTNLVTNTYRKAYVRCASGKEFFQGGESSCKPDVLWKQYATDLCKDECREGEATCSVDSNVCEVSAATCGVDDFQLSAPCYDGKPIICSSQNESELRAAKEKCYKNNPNAELKVDFGADGCRIYSCATSTQVCNSINDLPQGKKISCEERGGKFVTKVDDQGCLTYVECIGEKINDDNASINTTLIKDKMQLLDLAIKIETAKIELQKTAAKIKEIASYYETSGQASDANKFEKAANIIEAAANKLDEIKNEIKNNVDNFGEERAKNIREMIRNIKEELLKDALLAMLG